MATVLVIEDDDDAREVLCELLEFEGYDVLQARDGGEGLAIAESGASIDLILLDLQMPRMTGQEFLDARKDHALIAHVPVIVVSAWGRRVDLDGARVRLTKPVNLTMMFQAIAEALTARAS